MTNNTEKKQAFHILIVDDEPHILMALELLLQREDIKISKAPNGRLGIEEIKKHKFDCVLSDLKMPILDGIAFIKEVRGKLKNQVPFIFFTGHGDKALMIEVLQYGVFDFIDKPNFEMLENAVMKGILSNFKTNPHEEDINAMSEFRKLMQTAPQKNNKKSEAA